MIGRRAKRVTASFLLLWSYSAIHGAPPMASLSSSQIHSLDRVVLRISISEDDPDIAPDLEPLKEDFAVLNKEHSSKFWRVNREQHVERTWEILLSPKRTGEIVIPPLRLGTHSTNSLRLRVNEPDPLLRSTIEKAVFYEVETSHTEQYVHSAIYVSRHFFYRSDVQIVRKPTQELTVNDAVVINLDEDLSRRVEVRNETHYDVATSRHVVFAEKSGVIDIDPVSLVVAIPHPITGRHLSVHVNSAETSVSILPIPPGYPNDVSWFPAANVQIEDEMDIEDLAGLELGSAFVRKITVTTQDAYAAAIPAIDPAEVELLKQYRDPDDDTNTITDGRITGSKEISFSVLPIRAGAGRFPPVEVTWWNTEEHRLGRSTLPARDFFVHGDESPSRDEESTQDELEDVHSSIAGLDEKSVDPSLALPDSTAIPTETGVGWQIHLLYGLGWFVVLLLAIYLYWQRRPIHEDPESGSSTSIRQGLQQGPSALKRAMIDWLVDTHDMTPIKAAQTINRHPDGRSFLRRLNDAQYAEDVTPLVVNHDEVMRLLTKIAEDELRIPTRLEPAWSSNI